MQRCPYLHEMKERLLSQPTPTDSLDMERLENDTPTKQANMHGDYISHMNPGGIPDPPDMPDSLIGTVVKVTITMEFLLLLLLYCNIITAFWPPTLFKNPLRAFFHCVASVWNFVSLSWGIKEHFYEIFIELGVYSTYLRVLQLNSDGYGSHTSPAHARQPLVPKNSNPPLCLTPTHCGHHHHNNNLPKNAK